MPVASPTIENPIYIPDSSDVYIRTNVSADIEGNIDVKQNALFRPGSKFYSPVLTKNKYNKISNSYQWEEFLPKTNTDNNSCVNKEYLSGHLVKYYQDFLNAAYIGFDSLGNRIGRFAFNNMVFNSRQISISLLMRPEDFCFVPWDGEGELSGFPIFSLIPHYSGSIPEEEFESRRFTIYLARVRKGNYYEYYILSYFNNTWRTLSQWDLKISYGRGHTIYPNMLGRWICFSFAYDSFQNKFSIVLNNSDNLVCIDHCFDENNKSNDSSEYDVYYKKSDGSIYKIYNKNSGTYYYESPTPYMLGPFIREVINETGDPNYNFIKSYDTRYIFSIGEVYHPDGSPNINHYSYNGKSYPVYFSGLISRVRVIDGMYKIPAYVYKLIKTHDANSNVIVNKYLIDDENEGSGETIKILDGKKSINYGEEREKIFAEDNRKLLRNIYSLSSDNLIQTY